MSERPPPTSQEEWSRIDDAVSEAIALPTDEQAAHLRAALADVPHLVEEARALLLASGEGEAYLNALADRISADDHGLTLEGRRVGPYRLIECIARGGMGAVYRGERIDRQFEMEVAVKLLPVGMGSEAMRSRFLAERKILARLDHPGIARLFDGGFLDDGTPYFVMEYVDGEPIDRHCDTRRCSLEERLLLVERICEAVDFAHRNLVVHRDLKPGNILITPDGRVKLLDFGIAKVLDAEATGEPTALTQLGGRPMTPAYASPEQVRGESVTTATDVYSIGVLLYRLLTGRSPYRIEPDLTRAELERTVCEEIPPPPSRALEAETPPGLGDQDQLRRALRGDLDTVILKALQKDSARRYGSPAELLEDLRARRSGWPVRARPDTWAYRSSRFLRRNRRAAISAAAVLIMFAVYLFTLRGHAAQLEVERDLARHEATKAEEISSLLTELFYAADPGVHQGEPLTVRDLLDEGARHIEEELADVPDLQAEMLDRIGMIYLHLGHEEEALRLYRKAVELDDAPQDMAQRAMQLRTIGFLEMRMGNPGVADSLYTELETLVERLHGRRSIPYAELRYHQGLLHWQRGDPVRSDAAYEEAVEIYEALDSLQSDTYAYAAANLARSLSRRGRYEEAEGYARAALDLERALYGESDPGVVHGRSTLAGVLRQGGDFARAAAELDGLVELAARLWGEASFRVVLYSQELALTLTELGRFDEAEALFRGALEMDEALDPDNQANRASILTHYALLLERSGRLEAAEAARREALAIRLSGREDRGTVLMEDKLGLAGVLHRRGRWEEAERLARRGAVGLREAVGVTHPHSGRASTILGAVLRDAGRIEEAGPILESAAETLRAILPPDHPDRLLGEVELGALRAERGDQDGVGMIAEALERLTERYGAADARAVYAEGRLGLALAERGERAAARHLRGALSRLEGSGGGDDDWLRARLAAALSPN